MARLGPRARVALRYAFTVIVVVAVGVLFGRALAANWDEVSEAGLEFHPVYLAALFVFAAAVPVSGLLWGGIVDQLVPERRVRPLVAAAVHCASWLLKYIPGQVGSLVNKVLWGRRHGYSRTVMVLSFVYENVFLQIVSIVPSVVIILVTVGVGVFISNPVALALPLLALIPLGVVLHPRPLRAILNVASRRALKRSIPEGYVLTPGATAASLAGYVIPRVINGVGFVWIAGTVTEVAPTTWPYLAAAYALAGAVGILAFFVPSGIGVREAVLFACLLAIGVGAGEAVVISLLTRLVSTAADLLVAAFYGVVRLVLGRSQL